MAVQANAQGVVTGKFTIPAGVPAGTKLVRFQGAGGSSGQSAFIGQGTQITEVRRTVNTTVQQVAVDPLAQTFVITEPAQIAAVDLWLAAIGTSPIVLQIREVANGVPTAAILAETRLLPADINTTAHTRFAFAAPVILQANTEYAIVALCDDAVSELRLAELGKWDADAGQWVTSQPYQIGVMLSSSNASTWTPHQDRDLTFRLQKAIYTEVNKTVNLGTVAVTDATDLIVLAQDELPSSDTFITYTLGLPDGTNVVVANGQQIRLGQVVTGDISVSARLNGSANASPILFPGTQLVVGKVGTSGTYISRAIAGGPDVRVKVVFDANIPGGASVIVAYKGADVGDAWTMVPFVSSSPGDDGFYEITHELAGINENMVQIRLELTGTTAARPRVRNLRFMTI